MYFMRYMQGQAWNRAQLHGEDFFVCDLINCLACSWTSTNLFF